MNASNEYHFITTWRVPGSAEEIFDLLADPPALPRWWPAVCLDVRELQPGWPDGIGRVIDLHTKGWLPYTLRWQFCVTAVHRPHGFALEAWGDCSGRGEWRFVENGPWVEITCDWRVRVEKPLLQRFSFALRPLFEANQRWAMARGEQSLKLELARRHALSQAERDLIPLPPGPTTSSPVPLLLGGAAAALLLARVLRALGPRRSALLAGMGAGYLFIRRNQAG